MPPPKRSCTRRPPSGWPHPGPTARRLTAAPRSNVSSGHQSLEPPDVLQELEILDEIAKRVSGDMVNAGIASIDTLWTAGQDLAPPYRTTEASRCARHRSTPRPCGP